MPDGREDARFQALQNVLDMARGLADSPPFPPFGSDFLEAVFSAVPTKSANDTHKNPGRKRAWRTPADANIAITSLQ